jgi:Spy/CpxP family protein refolding chaperone
MRPRRHLALFVILLLTAGGTFVATYAWQSGPTRTAPVTAPYPAAGRLCAWLDLDPAVRDAVSDLESAYRGERSTLEAAVAAERDALAALFESGEASDAEILEQVEQVIAANNALERRTARFLLDVRPHLTTAQQQRLLRHFAEGVREGGRYRWRHGWQHQGGNNDDGGEPPAGRGRGRGGPPWSGGQRR